MKESIDISVFKDFDSTPTLILVDLQKEYLCVTRKLGLQTIEPAIRNCRRLLARARERRIPVIFTRWVQQATVFNKNGRFSDWIDGFTPTGSDTVIEHSWPTCYSSPEFGQIMDCGGGRNAVIAGLTSSMACLATIVDGSQRRHRFTFISDASICHSTSDYTELEVHRMATVMIAHFARINNSDEWSEEQSEARGVCQIARGESHAFG